MNRLLIVIDAQEDFTRGALRNEDAIQALPIIHQIVTYAHEHNITSIYTMDTHYEDYMETQEGHNLPVLHCIYLTKGWHLCPEVLSEDEPTIITKETFGYSDWASEYKAFEDIDEIWMVGFCTDICVSANFQIIKATYPEIPITIIEDGCAGVTPEKHAAALEVMRSCQAKVVKWEELRNEI